MRKLLLSALACVAFAGSSFASNEIVECKEDLQLTDYTNISSEESEGRPCKVYVWATSPEGKREWKTGEGGTLNWDDCGKYKDGFIKDLREKGFHIAEDDITVIWG